MASFLKLKGLDVFDGIVIWIFGISHPFAYGWIDRCVNDGLVEIDDER